MIEKHLAAIGGRAALTKLKSRSMTGTIALSTPVGELSGPVEIMNQAPNKARTLIKLDLTAVGVPEPEMLARQPQTRFLVDLPKSERELRTAWQERWGLDEKRRVVRMALRDLVINPPKRSLPRFDPDRVEPDWRV